MCKEVASLEIGQKLKVTFYNNRKVGANINLFSRHLGKIVRDRNICPLRVSSWHDIKQKKLNHMWAAVEVINIHMIYIIYCYLICRVFLSNIANVFYLRILSKVARIDIHL